MSVKQNAVLGFTGAYMEPVIGGYPLGNGYRVYLPWLGRFATPDDWSPFGFGGINPYSYCGADPINHTDPSGHMMDWNLDDIGSFLADHKSMSEGRVGENVSPHMSAGRSSGHGEVPDEPLAKRPRSESRSDPSPFAHASSSASSDASNAAAFRSAEYAHAPLHMPDGAHGGGSSSDAAFNPVGEDMQDQLALIQANFSQIESQLPDLTNRWARFRYERAAAQPMARTENPEVLDTDIAFLSIRVDALIPQVDSVLRVLPEHDEVRPMLGSMRKRLIYLGTLPERMRAQLQRPSVFIPN